MVARHATNPEQKGCGHVRKNYRSAFVTRQHMVSRDFEIYYYSDLNFSGVKKHAHDYYEFYFFLEGRISMFIDEQEFHPKSGDVILIPPGISHRLEIHDESIPYQRFVFWISKDYYKQLTNYSSDYSYIVDQALTGKNYIYHNDLISFNTIQALLHRLIEEIHSDRFGHNTKVLLCVDDLLLHLNRMAYESHHTNQIHQNQTLYESLMQYIEGHLTEELSLENLAKVFFVSKYHIAHVFKEYMGISIHKYIIKKRLSMCRDAILYENESNISKVFALYGFKDYSSFYRAFKKEFGVAPKEYKQKNPTII